MNIGSAIEFLDKAVPNPTNDLPDEIFYYISRTTPLINVDLLIKDENGRTLLAWRDDKYSGTGWHIPGGIIRHKESMKTRIKKVAQKEIGAEIEYEPVPIAINEMIHLDRTDRSHFISLLFKCFLNSSFNAANKGVTSNTPGYLKWHNKCPDNLIKFHEVYRELINGKGNNCES